MSEERTNMAIRDLKHYVIDNMSLDVQDDFEIICKYITNLQQKVEQLEKEKNTLMYSLTLVRQKWNNDKARYRRKAKVYREQRNQLENIRKEAIEYIEKCGGMELVNDYSFPEKSIIDKEAKTNLLNILNKGNNKEK